MYVVKLLSQQIIHKNVLTLVKLYESQIFIINNNKNKIYM